MSFDVEGPPLREDFLNDDVAVALFKVLELLKKYHLTGLFFITGTIAEQIRRYPKVLKLLAVHEIGYHGSSHSTKPAIFEYTDVENYAKATEISRRRETSSIDPLTGKVNGEGGIFSLQQTFREKEITAFRAPFFCWSPPHMEALRELKFKFDFSADICNSPVWHKGTTFFPYPILIDSPAVNFPIIAKKMLSQKFCVLLMHPSHIIFKPEEHFYHRYRNPFYPVRIRKRDPYQIAIEFLMLKTFLSGLYRLKKRGLISLSGTIESAREKLDPNEVDLVKVYDRSLYAARSLFGYKPKFLPSHFRQFIRD